MYQKRVYAAFVCLLIFCIWYLFSASSETSQVTSFSHWWAGDHVTDRLNFMVDKSRCINPERVGDPAGVDGGWWTCMERVPQTRCVVYSFGIRDNFSFDAEMVKKGCEVHGFDPSKAGEVSIAGYNKLGAEYNKFGIGGANLIYAPGTVPFEWPGIDYLKDTNSDPWDLRTMNKIMKDLNHASVSVLKLDVEGSEWSAFPSILTSDWKQLLVELHFPPNQYDLTRGPNGGATLHRWGKPCENEVNRLALLREVGAMADLWNLDWNGDHCLELSYVRKKMD